MSLSRGQFIEQVLRQIYGGYVSEDASITPMLVNQYIDQAVAFAAKSNYTDNIKLEGVSFINNSFYTTFKNLSPVKDEQGLWKIQLPQVPVGIGVSEGISTLQFKDDKGLLSYPCIPLSQNQKTYFQTMTPLPNKTLFYVEGDNIFVVSNIQLDNYSASVTMISGGNSQDLDSTLNVPGDYVPLMVDYIQKQLLLEKTTPKDLANDGQDLAQN